MVTDHNNFEELSGWTVSPPKNNDAIFNTALFFKVCILTICKLVIQLGDLFSQNIKSIN